MCSSVAQIEQIFPVISSLLSSPSVRWLCNREKCRERLWFIGSILSCLVIGFFYCIWNTSWDRIFDRSVSKIEAQFIEGKGSSCVLRILKNCDSFSHCVFPLCCVTSPNNGYKRYRKFCVTRLMTVTRHLRLLMSFPTGAVRDSVP